MTEHVSLVLKRNRGWPWPESTWGLTPMFGEDGWCHRCGVPKRSQTGSLVLQRNGFTTVEGAWVPNWQFDAYCVDARLAERLESEFRVQLLEVQWAKDSPGQAWQLVPPVTGNAWFDPEELRQRTLREHGESGARCPECHVWRWLPLPISDLPPLATSLPDDVDLAASPEWFGDGMKAFREIRFRRELAELLAEASPRDFRVSA